MKVEINHHIIEVAPGITSLSELLETEGFTGVGQAVAIDNTVVPKAKWAETVLKDGMKIIVISAVCGG